MHPKPRLLPILVALTPLATAQEKTTYDDHVLPLFQQACLNCHNPDKTKGGLDLSSFAGTLKGSSGGKIVEAGNSGSTLISVVRHTAEPKMPPEGDQLSPDQIQILTRWIEGGLLETPSSSARKPSRPAFALTPGTDPAARPEGPPPMPAHLLLEPPVITLKASPIRALAASPWAPLLAVTGQRQILLHHTETLDLVGILPFPEGDPVSLAFTPDARYLIVGGGVPGKSGVTVTFDVTTGSRLLSTAGEYDSILAADIRPNLDIVATGGPSRLLKLRDPGVAAPLHSVKKHTDWITALDLSPDGVLLASGDRNGGVWVWESGTASEFHTLRAHQAAITATVFRADSDILGTASEDGTVRFWEMNGGSEIRKIDAHPGGVTALSLARDGAFLTVGRDFKARFWKPDFTPARDLSGKLPALPTAAALDAGGKRAFIGDIRGTVLVLDTASGKSLGEIQSNPPTIETRLAAIEAGISRLEKPSPATPEASRQIPNSEIAALKQSHKHWSAAAINARAIRTRQLARSSALATEEAQLHFTEAAANVTRQAELLGLKRHQRRLFASHMENAGPQPDARAEFSATLHAIDLVIARELEVFHRLEDRLVAATRLIDPSARLAHDQKLTAESLELAYSKAIE